MRNAVFLGHAFRNHLKRGEMGILLRRVIGCDVDAADQGTTVRAFV